MVPEPVITFKQTIKAALVFLCISAIGVIILMVRDYRANQATEAREKQQQEEARSRDQREEKAIEADRAALRAATERHMVLEQFLDTVTHRGNKRQAAGQRFLKTGIPCSSIEERLGVPTSKTDGHLTYLLCRATRWYQEQKVEFYCSPQYMNAVVLQYKDDREDFSTSNWNVMRTGVR